MREYLLLGVACLSATFAILLLGLLNLALKAVSASKNKKGNNP